MVIPTASTSRRNRANQSSHLPIRRGTQPKPRPLTSRQLSNTRLKCAPTRRQRGSGGEGRGADDANPAEGSHPSLRNGGARPRHNRARQRGLARFRNKAGARSGARHSCCPLKNSPISPRGVAYDLCYVGSPSVESLFALCEKFVPLIDSRNS